MSHKIPRHMRPGYPIAGYNGHTTDDKHCPRCGSREVTLLGFAIASGRRIGLCAECGENYIVESERAEQRQAGGEA